mgnify:CR=1 FL=1
MTLEKLQVMIGADISALKTQMKNAKRELKGLSDSAKKSTQFKINGNKVSGEIQKITRATEKASSGFKKMAKLAASVFGIKALVSFSKDCVEASSDLTEVQNVVDTVFGTMSEEINSWAKNAKTQFGISELSAKKYTSTMGAMLKSSGLTGDKMKTMSLNLSALAADMASFYNISNDLAFDKIRAGIAGEIEPLRQLGINMSVTNLEAYALSRGITKSYQAMSQSEQAILRYNYLLSVTKDAQGDFARTSSSWANQVKILKETITQLKSNIGALIIQALTPLLQWLNRIVSKLAEVSSAVKNVFGIKDAADQSAGGLSDTAASAEEVGSNLTDAEKAAKKLKSAIMGFDELNVLSVDTSDTDNTGQDGGTKIDDPYSGAFEGVNEKISKIGKATEAMLNKVIEKLHPIADAVKLVKDTWTTAWQNGNGEQVIENFKGYLNALLDTVHNIGVAFQQAWKMDNAGLDFINSIQNGLSNIIGLARSVQQSIADAFSTSAGVEFIQSIIGYFNMLVDLVGSFAEGLRAAWDNNSAGTELIQSLMDGFSSVLELITKIGETLAETFKNEHGQNMFSSLISLAKEFAQLVADFADSFKAAWAENELGQSILNNIFDIITNIVEGVKNLAQNFREAWNENEIGRQIMQTILEMIDHVLEKAKEMSEAFKQWAKDIDFKPLLESVKKLAEAFSDLVGVISDKLAEAFEGTLLPLAKWTIEEGLPELIEAFAKALEWVANVLDKIPPDTLVALAAGFIAVKVAVSGFGKALSGLVALGSIATSIQSLIGLFGLFSGAAGGAAAGASAVAGAAGAASGAAAEAATGMTTWFEAVTLASGASAGAAASFAGIGTAVSGIAGAFLLLFPVFADFEGSWDRIRDNLKTGFESLKSFPETIKGSFSGIKEQLESVFSGLGEMANTGIQKIQTAFSGVSGFIGSAFSGIQEVVSPIFSNLGEMASAGVQGIQTAFSGVSGFIGSAFSGIQEVVSPIFSNLGEMANTGVQAIQSAFSGVSGFIGSAFSGIVGEINPIIGEIVGAFEGLGPQISGVFTEVAQVIPSLFKGCLSAVQSVIDGIAGAIEKISSILDSLNAKITGTNNAVNTLNNTASSMQSSTSAVSPVQTYSMPALPELAGGGVLKRATAVVAGEYPGSGTNPEIVSPQKLLQQIITKSNESMASDIVSGIAGIITQTDNQNGSQELSAKISGDDLLFVVKNAERRRGMAISKNFAFGGL